jgi:hypothetical protein
MNTPNLVLNFRGIHSIKVTMELILRQIFASELIDKRYRYSPDEKETKIRIYRVFTKRLEHYPAITITAGGFPVHLLALGNDYELTSEHPNPDPNNLQPLRTAGGHMIVPIELKVWAKESVDDRENLTDILIMIFRIFAQRGQFKKFGWVNWRVGGETQFTDADTRMVFNNTIVVDTQTDYTYLIKPEQATLIEQIALRVIPVINLEDNPPEEPGD